MSIENPKGGGLIINLNELNFVRVGDVDIFLHGIKVSGRNGGKREVSIRLVGPRTTKITRFNK